MKEYIEREALLAELQEELDFETNMYTEEQNKWFNIGLNCAIRDVKCQPAVEVVEVKHGKWIEELIELDWCDDDVDVGYRCSCCGILDPFICSYCPNCGARMDGGIGTEVDE